MLLEQAPSVNEIRDLNVDPEFFAQIDKIGEGSCFVKIKTDSVHGEELFFPLWKGKNSFNLMVNKHETAELLYRLFGIDKAALDKEKKEKEDAEKKAEENVEEKTEAAPVTAEASAAEATPEPAA